MKRREFLKLLATLPMIGIVPFVRAEKVREVIKPGEPVGITSEGVIVMRSSEGRLVPYKNEISIE